MAESNDAGGGQKSGAAPGTPARSGPATGAGPVKVGVYEQPARPAQSPLMKWLPILIGLLALAFFAYRFLAPRPAATTNDAPNPPAAVRRDTNSGATNRTGGDSTMTGNGSEARSAAKPAGSGGGKGNAEPASSGGATEGTANPPGPAGAKRP